MEVDMDYHQDVEQDQQMIMQTIGPILEQLAQRLSEVEQMLYKLITGAYDATKQHKRTQLADTIGSQFGEKIGPYKDFYDTAMQRDMVSDIIDLLDAQGIEGDGIGEFVERFLDSAKNRFGKYWPGASSVEVEVSAEPEAAPEPEPEAEKPVDQMELLKQKLSALRKGA